MAVKPTWRISQKAFIPLSTLMLIFTGLSVTGYYSPLRRNGEAILFTTSRMPTGEEHFLNSRQKAASVWVYKGLHVVPAVLWSIAMPLQHIDSLRKKWPALHRTAGYFILSLSLLLSMTGYWFFFSDNAYTHKDVFHMHHFPGLGAIRWPTFELSLWVLAPFYWLTIYKAAVTARAKDFVRHRKWAVLHTLAASIISVERFAIISLYAVGYALSVLPQDKVHEFFGVGHTLEDMADAELSVFALGNVLAYIVVLSWTAYLCGRAGYFDGVKGYLSSGVENEIDTKGLDAKKVE